MVPGEVLTAPDDIVLNGGYSTITLSVINTGAYPIQVGSHYHFFETNVALAFDRARAWGYRLNVPAGVVVRFNPGRSRKVLLVAYGGNRIAWGFNGLVNGQLKS